MKKLLKLFLCFLKVGAFTFGGGLAMISLLEHECVEKRGWITKDEFLNMVGIAESTPGPVAINAATYIGYSQAGFWGALFATVGVVLPSFIIIYVISLFFEAFLSIDLVARAFRGIGVAVVFLILSAGVKLFRKMEKTPLNTVLFCLSFVLVILIGFLDLGVSKIWLILGCALASLFVYLCGKARKEVGR